MMDFFLGVQVFLCGGIFGYFIGYFILGNKISQEVAFAFICKIYKHTPKQHRRALTKAIRLACKEVM